MEIRFKKVYVHLDEKTLKVKLNVNGVVWENATDFSAYLMCNGRKELFHQILDKKFTQWENAIGIGIDVWYLREDRSETNARFKTRIWIEKVSENILFEIIPIKDVKQIEEICWPGHFEFHNDSADWYTLINVQQGLLLPNNWKNKFEMPLFGGKLYSSDSYMPWYAQVKDDNGYLAICEQPWDALYYVEHPKSSIYTHIGLKWIASLDTISYRRSLRFIFMENTNYVKICKRYRQYVKEQGNFITLEQKKLTLDVEKLIGAAIIHAGIKTNILPSSYFYDKENAENNCSIITYAQRGKELEEYYRLGLSKAYIHLDGWTDDGYDNKHPDALEACEDAGGWTGLKKLENKVHQLGYSWGIHDQYRDYYFDAASFSKDLSCMNSDGTIPEYQVWAGGKQSHLCATQILNFVKRNYENLKNHDIQLDGTYIDIFNCNAGDECFNTDHRMTRRDSFMYREKVLKYLMANNILTSSEEVVDWSIPSVIFAHYAPYDFMMRGQKADRNGVPVPLFNLVYHECVIIPWIMEKYEEEDYMLYALINGGIPYLIREAPYKNIDGNFEKGIELTTKEKIDRCKEVMRIHSKVAYEEMVSHCFLDKDFSKQQSIFSDGTTVTIDLVQNRYWVTHQNKV